MLSRRALCSMSALGLAAGILRPAGAWIFTHLRAGARERAAVDVLDARHRLSAAEMRRLARAPESDLRALPRKRYVGTCLNDVIREVETDFGRDAVILRVVSEVA